MEKRVQVRDKNYKGIVCVFVGTEDGSVFIEIKEPGVKEKKFVKINKYLSMLNEIAS
ncbi:MAG: hypothetical protein WBI07_13160 [Mobilitalea sp.]